MAAKQSDERWDDEADVVVVGFGGAGAAAAIEAADQGAEVLVLERFSGGGATRKSGGVMYCGGGTELQQKAGYEDTPENMLAYLKAEAGDAVSEEVLRAFCEQSVENHEWVRGHGVDYTFGFEPLKTFYPADDVALYYSGNEPCPPFSELAVKAARGHRAVGKGLTGKQFFEPLRKAAEQRGVKISYYTRCLDLIRDDDGAVIGVEVSQVRFFLWRWMIWLCVLFASTLGAMSGIFLSLYSWQLRLFEALGRRRRVRARGGVVLSTGGFIFNRKMVREFIPHATKAMRLGTVADDGKGIELGRAAGGALRKMERSAIWLFYAPPRAFLQGIFMSRQGQRICCEEYYGATLAMHMVQDHNAEGILLVDRSIRNRARAGLWALRSALVQFIFGTIHLYFNRTKAGSLDKLARKCRVPPEAMRAAVERYNAGVAAGKDEMGKDPELLASLETGPYYAVNCNVANWRFFMPAISLGGLETDTMTARVTDGDGRPIPGLYAAGRTAVGVCSHSYLTGLAIADCIFSGRNAGRHAAAQAKEAAQAQGASKDAEPDA
ncbi:MAG: FAD-binding protein [bacterium]